MNDCYALIPICERLICAVYYTQDDSDCMYDVVFIQILWCNDYCLDLFHELGDESGAGWDGG